MIPKIERSEAEGIAQAHSVNDRVLIIGIRGFVTPGQNKRGLYDDAIFLTTPDEVLGANGNTDPSKQRAGIAVLQPGIYDYEIGLHGVHHLDMNNPGDQEIMRQLRATGKDRAPIEGRILPYWAFRQAGPVSVLRDGQKTPETKISPAQWPWIDIHRGGYQTTSSEGCQTIHPDQWANFREKGFAAMKRYGIKKIKYILISR